jgi:hypothetical protein
MNLKKGALPRRPSVQLPRLENFLDAQALAQAMPAAVGVIDRESPVSSFPMYANDRVGCCTCSGMGHACAIWTALSHMIPGGAMFTDTEILKMYSAVSGYNPATGQNDNGAELYQVCNYMMTTGITDTTGKLHKIAGYADIASYNNLGYLKQVLNAFGTVYLGVNVGDAEENAFSMGQPWTLPERGVQVGPNGIDHCVIMSLSAFAVPGVMNDETIITWGAEQKMNVNWAWTNVGEAIAIFSEDWMEANGDSPIGQAAAQIIAELKSVPESGDNPSNP